ncbi:glycosyltransferase family 4 protein [Suttonella indologenes]|uniref:D-inositol-3-phosphate glycosyltransferase n=1 Tax=Suttonella indologenes TaxID=13276 RepID=A0A380N2A2_9GAMM|nr:glycosyltransferase [Suttonella indologenes]SUO97907.1 D-inositol-3-phosphate glycosyltransferase [Suttonella indologenes]
MINILYVHDHIFKKNGRNIYSEGKITDETFCRYIFNSKDKIYVLSRMEEKENASLFTEIKNTQVIFNPVFGITIFQIYFINLFKNICLIFKMLKKTDYLILRMPSFLGLLVFLLNLIFRRKFFVEFVGDPKDALLNAITNKNLFILFAINIIVLLNKLVLKKASGVIYVTNKILQKKYPTFSYQECASNVEIDIEKINLSVESYKIKNKEIVIGIIASFNNPYKGIGMAIDSVKLLKNKGVNLKLRILGSGKLEENYKKHAENLNLLDQVFFDGILSSRADINFWLDSLDIYIQPSYTEGLPRALIEAMARGLPIVATNVGGIPELLSSDFLIEPGSSIALSDKLQLLISSQKIRYEQGVLNYEKSKEYDSDILKEKRQKFWTTARIMVKDL